MKNYSELLLIRRELHKLAEIGGQEKHTSEFIFRELEKLNPDKIITNLGGYGVAAVFGTDDSKTLMLRCEMDAVPIEDMGVEGYKSNTPGYGHKCGHDGHMAIMLGVAKELENKIPEKGRVVLLFQPDEESGNGAALVLKDAKFNKIQPDYIFALHNYPSLPTGTIACKPGVFAAASTGIKIKLIGNTSHAAEPEKGINPLASIFEISNYINALSQAEKYIQGTTVYVSTGEREAFGVTPGYGEIMATIRSFDNEQLALAKKKTEEKIRHIALKENLEYRIEYTDQFNIVVNEEECFKLVKKTAEMNKLKFEELTEAYKWSEDFGNFTRDYKGALFCIGAGKKNPPLHDTTYDFPEDIIPLGIGIFKSLIDLIIK